MSLPSIVILAMLAQSPGSGNLGEGNLLLTRGEIARAQECFRYGICEARAAGEPLPLSASLLAYANASVLEGQFLNARRSLDEAALLLQPLSSASSFSLRMALEGTEIFYFLSLEDFARAAEHVEADDRLRSKLPGAVAPPTVQFNAAVAWLGIGEHERARDVLTRCQSRFQQMNDKEGEHRTRSVLASLARQEEDFAEAALLLEGEAQDEIGLSPASKISLALDRCHLAAARHDLLDLEAAWESLFAQIASCEQEELVLRALQGSGAHALALGSACMQKQNEAWQRLMQSTSQPRIEASAANQLGCFAMIFGRFTEAESYFRRADRVAGQAQLEALHANARLNLGRLAYALNDDTGACAHAEEALKLTRALQFRRQEAGALHCLGLVARRRQDNDLATLHLERSAEIFRDLRLPRYEAKTRIVLGQCLLEKNELEAAEALFRSVLSVAAKNYWPDVEARAWARLAELKSRGGKHSEAEVLAREACKFFARIASWEQELELLDERALAAMARGALDDVESLARRAALLIERPRILGLPPLEQASRRALFSEWDMILQDLSRARLAKATTQEERRAALSAGFARASAWKARALLDRGNVPARSALPSEPEGLDGIALRNDVTEYFEGPLASSSVASSSLLLEIAEESGVALERLAKSFESTCDPCAQSEHCSLETRVRATLAGEHAVLIDFVEGHDTIAAWILTATELDLVPLGERRGIAESAAKFLKSLEAVAPAEVVLSSGYELYQRLLQPILARLPFEPTHVTIVPSPALGRLPFFALPMEAPSPKGGFRSAQYLDDLVESTIVPSAATLLQLVSRQETVATGRALVIGDPDLTSEADRDSTRGPLARLAFARKEALQWCVALVAAQKDLDPATRASIALSLVSDSSVESISNEVFDLRLGNAASHGALLQDLKKYSMLYVGAHATADEHSTRATGVFLSPDEASSGFVSVEEIVSLELSAPVVVLSCCSTARGAALPGEGLQSMAWAFLYAGARHVVASLWDVDDPSTFVLMESFCRHWIEKGLSVGAALRAARLELRRNARTRAGVVPVPESNPANRTEDRGMHPYYWAAFTGIGPPR